MFSAGFPPPAGTVQYGTRLDKFSCPTKHKMLKIHWKFSPPKGEET
jgi:hypothetical protein